MKKCPLYLLPPLRLPLLSLLLLLLPPLPPLHNSHFLFELLKHHRHHLLILKVVVSLHITLPPLHSKTPTNQPPIQCNVFLYTIIAQHCLPNSMHAWLHLSLWSHVLTFCHEIISVYRFLCECILMFISSSQQMYTQ